MGNSSGSQAASAAAAGAAVQKRIEKEKKRAKRFCCCCTWCNISAIAFVVTGILLLVFFAYKEKPSLETAQGLTYAGIAFMLLGVLLMLIGVVFGIAMYVIYRKLSGKSSTKAFVHKTYPPGTAPYPQQDWGNLPDPHHPQGSPIAPAQPGQEVVAPDTIVPEVRY